MKKKETLNEHKERINEVLYYIYKNLSSKLIIEDLAKISSYSPYHFQRIFKEITQRSVTEYIRELRLQWAANLLIFNPDSTITSIAYNCGFLSSSTFSNEFKKYYDMSPKLFRLGEYKTYLDQHPTKEKEISFENIDIITLEEMNIAYIRHQGYDNTIRDMWKKFLYLLDTQYGIKNPQMYAFHHSNPNITSLEECRYIACIKNEKSYNIYPKGDIGVCSIVGGLYANIRFQGVYEDVLSLYKGIYHQWLPRSEFEALSSSAHVLYHKNNFIQEDETFDIEFRVPIRYK